MVSQGSHTTLGCYFPVSSVTVEPILSQSSYCGLALVLLCFFFFMILFHAGMAHKPVFVKRQKDKLKLPPS